MPASGTASETSKGESGHDGSRGSGDENLEDFQSLEHLAYLEHTEYRAPTRNIAWGEEEEDKEILRQIFDELEITTKLASSSRDEGLTESTNDMSTDLSSAGSLGDLSEERSGKTTSAGSKSSGNSTRPGGADLDGKSTTAEAAEMPILPTGSSFNNWQGRVHFVTKEPPSHTVDEKEPTQPSSVTNSNPWRIRFEVQRPQTNIGNSVVGSPEFEVTGPKFGSPEFEVTDQKFGSPEFEVTDPKFGSPEFEMTVHNAGSPEFEVTDQKTGEDTSTTFPSSRLSSDINI